MAERIQNEKTNMRPVTTKIVSLSNIKINLLCDTIYSGRYELTPELHTHFNYEILLCTQGEFQVDNSDGSFYRLHENDVCFIPIEYLHGTSAVTNQTCQKLALRFYIEQRTPPAIGCYETIASNLAAHRKPVQISSPSLTSLVKDIHTVLSMAGEIPGVTLELLLIQFFASLFQTLLTDKTSGEVSVSSDMDNRNARAYKIEMFFANHYGEQIVEEDLARFLNLSLRQTTRELKKLYGMSFRQKLIHIRMRRAANLLLHTDNGIQTIAAQTGYTSASSFCTAFKNHYDMTPLAYRTRMRDGE